MGSFLTSPRAWNVIVRNVFRLDRRTHRYLIEHVSQCLHSRTMLACRFVKFHHSMINSDKFIIRFLSRLCESDQRTVFGGTLTDICVASQTQLAFLTPFNVKQNVKYHPIPEEEVWRASILNELIAQPKPRPALPSPTTNLGARVDTNLLLVSLCLSLSLSRISLYSSQPFTQISALEHNSLKPMPYAIRPPV